ncbi:hypothetical protein ACLOJK_035231 [Asimina triloba]
MGGVTSSMASKFAFFPPDPPSYEVATDGPDGQARLTGVPYRENVEVVKLATKRGSEIVAMHVRNPEANLTVLYSHGNAADLGQMYELFTELSVHLRVNLMGEQNTYADIEAAYRCLEEKFGGKEENTILYGQSVGSGPTLELAARLPRLRAVVLHSPILSGLRVMYPVKRTYWFDIYKGTSDDVVDCSHGKQLWELCREKYEPLWLKGGKHCDLELYPEYISHLKRFILAVEKSPNTRTATPQISDLPEPSRKSSDFYDLPRKSSDCLELPRKSSDCLELPRKSSDFLELPWKSSDCFELPRKSSDCFELPRKSSDFLELPRKSTDRRDKPRPSADHKEKSRPSTDRKEKSRASTDRREKSRRSVDRFEKARNSMGLLNRSRNSIDRSDKTGIAQ